MSESVPRLDGKGFHIRPPPAGAATPRKRWRVPRFVIIGAVVLMLAAVIVPFGWFAQQAATAQRTAERMKGIGLAMLAFEDEHRQLPRRANFDVQGQPLLSWRVHLLPSLKQGDLYRRFHLDEPWDSPHNRGLIAEMPASYLTPGTSLEIGKTCFLVPVADHVRFRNAMMSETMDEDVFSDWGPTAFPQSAPNVARAAFARAADHHLWSRFGLPLNGIYEHQRVILLVQVPPQRSVVWTRPDDFDVNPDVTARELADIGFGNFLAVTANGTVHQLPRDMDQKTLLAVLAHNSSIPVRLPDEPPLPDPPRRRRQ